MIQNRNSIQRIWGVALLLVGVGVFFRIPQVMPRIEAIEQFASASAYIRFCFYFIGVVLVGGGLKKIHKHWRSPEPTDDSPSN